MAFVLYVGEKDCPLHNPQPSFLQVASTIRLPLQTFSRYARMGVMILN